MKRRGREDLTDLFKRFKARADAEAAAREVQAAEEWLEAYPAPQPDASLLQSIKLRVATRLVQRHGALRAGIRYTSAAVIVVGVFLVGLLEHSPAGRSQISYAALIPTAIWESDDIASDDMEIAYFNSEIERIETQIHALETGEIRTADRRRLDDIETQLVTIAMDFWKE
jgi:hypothetical protein